MTVAVLKEELKKRGLDATGLKAALVARLEEAMAGEDDGAAAEAAAPEEEEAKEEPKEEAGEEEDVRAKAEEMAEKAMAEHAASEKKRERSPEQDDAPPEAKSAKSDGEHAAAPSSAQGGLTKDGQNLATYEMPDGQVRKDVPTQGNEGRIIGRGGSKIRELQDMFRTRITMNRPAGLAEVVGMLDHVNDCCDEITRIVEDGNVREAAERAGQPALLAAMRVPTADRKTGDPRLGAQPFGGEIGNHVDSFGLARACHRVLHARHHPVALRFGEVAMEQTGQELRLIERRLEQRIVMVDGSQQVRGRRRQQQARGGRPVRGGRGPTQDQRLVPAHGQRGFPRRTGNGLHQPVEPAITRIRARPGPRLQQVLTVEMAARVAVGR